MRATGFVRDIGTPLGERDIGISEGLREKENVVREERQGIR